MEVRWLLWDDHNIEHIAKHNVTPAEVEEVVFGSGMRGPFGDDPHRYGRLVFFGYEAYVVTARPASVRERDKYLEES